MKNKLYLYSDISCYDFIKDLLFDFEIISISNKLLTETNFKNKHVLFVIRYEMPTIISHNFYQNNNIIVFSSIKEKQIDEKKYSNTKFFYGPIFTKYFLGIIKSSQTSIPILYRDLKILGQEITNLNFKKSCQLTNLEREILIELVEKKQISREYFLEYILKIKKNIETKTIESHLTRIRKKLLSIKSVIQISSRDNKFFLED